MIDGYILPSNFTLSTLFSQTSALQIMMKKSIVEFKLLSKKEKRVLLLLNYISSRNPFLLNIGAKLY